MEFDKEALIDEIGVVIKELLQEVRTDVSRLSAELEEMKGEGETEKKELKKQVKKLEKEPAGKPVESSKFSDTPKEKELSANEYRQLSKKEKYWYNLEKLKN